MFSEQTFGVALLHMYCTSIQNNTIFNVCRYDSESANCFSFVLFCLRSVGLYTGVTEDDFISEVVIPRTSEAARYITLYRQLVNNGGLYVKDSEHFYI